MNEGQKDPTGGYGCKHILDWARGKCRACYNQAPGRRGCCQECKESGKRIHWTPAWIANEYRSGQSGSQGGAGK